MKIRRVYILIPESSAEGEALRKAFNQGLYEKGTIISSSYAGADGEIDEGILHSKRINEFDLWTPLIFTEKRAKQEIAKIKAILAESQDER